MSGSLVVLEGLDGSGKSTQFHLLCQWLKEQGRSFRDVSFPRYEAPECVLVKEYLQGDYGMNPDDVSPYTASVFYAVDRYASFKKDDWGEFYRSGGLVLSARYTTSNAAHQAAKLPIGERGVFLSWLSDFEFRLMGIPAPDMVLYLDIPLELSLQRVTARAKETHTHKDIHEMDSSFLERSLKAGEYAARYYGWQVVRCQTQDGRERTVEEIQEELRDRLFQFLKERGM